MDNQTDHQKMMSMKEMIAEKSRKNFRDKRIEKSRVSNPFTEQKKFIQTYSTQETDFSQYENIQTEKITTTAAISSTIQQQQNNQQSKIDINNNKIQQLLQQEQNQELELESQEISYFQNLTLTSFKFKLSQLSDKNINSDDAIKLLENIPEFFKENKSQMILQKFKDMGGLEILHQIMKNLTLLNPIPYQVARILEIFSIFAQVEEFINEIWINNETIDLFLNLCIENQNQQILEQLFSLLGFLVSDSGIEKRDYIRQTQLLKYICVQIDKYSMNTYLVASIIVRNGIWLLVSLCSDLPEEGNYDYCRDTLHIFIRFLKCSSGTVSQECTWVLGTLIPFYISQANSNQIQNIQDFIQLGLHQNLTDTFKLNCLTTTQCALQILKQLIQASPTIEMKQQIANEHVLNNILDLFKVEQRQLVFKVLFDFIQCLTQSSELIQILINQEQFLKCLFKTIKNPDTRYNFQGIKTLQSIISNASEQQLVQIVELGLFIQIKEFLDQSGESSVINNVAGLQIIEQILEAGDSIYSNSEYNLFKIKMDQSGLLQNIEDLQLSSKEAVSENAVQIIERFCLAKHDRIEEEQ